MDQSKSQHGQEATGRPQQDPEFRAGDRVVLTAAPDDYPAEFNITPGMTGQVELVDSLGTVHIKFDGGQQFGIIASARHLLKHENEHS